MVDLYIGESDETLHGWIEGLSEDEIKEVRSLLSDLTKESFMLGLRFAKRRQENLWQVGRKNKVEWHVLRFTKYGRSLEEVLSNAQQEGLSRRSLGRIRSQIEEIIFQNSMIESTSTL